MKSVSDKKASLRLRLKMQREGIPIHTRREKSALIQTRLLQLEEIRSSKSVFCFISREPEVYTHTIINELLEAGKTVSVPFISPDKTMLAIPFENWESLSPGELGILSPGDKKSVAENIDTVITPGLGFSRKGQRIGFGRGYYDRWFQRNPQVFKIALAFQEQIAPDIPTDENDISVNLIVTDSELIETEF